MRIYSVILLYSCQWPETCKLKFKVWAFNFLSVYTFLWCSLFPLIEERLRGKTQKAKVMLYSEKEHDQKYTKTEMNESFSTSALVHRIIVVSRPMPNHCPLCSIPQTFWKLYIPGESLCKGKRGRWTWQRAEGWVRCYVKKWFWKISSYVLNI